MHARGFGTVPTVRRGIGGRARNTPCSWLPVSSTALAAVNSSSRDALGLWDTATATRASTQALSTPPAIAVRRIEIRPRGSGNGLERNSLGDELEDVPRAVILSARLTHERPRQKVDPCEHVIRVPPRCGVCADEPPAPVTASRATTIAARSAVGAGWRTSLGTASTSLPPT